LRCQDPHHLELAAQPVSDQRIDDLQGLFHDGLTLLALERAGDAALLERLERVLAPGRHQLVRLPAALPAPLSIFEHSAMLDWLVCEALSHTTRDLARWPAQGQDEPLYGLSSCPRCGFEFDDKQT
jgi:hypothetical protein